MSTTNHNHPLPNQPLPHTHGHGHTATATAIAAGALPTTAVVASTNNPISAPTSSTSVPSVAVGVAVSGISSSMLINDPRNDPYYEPRCVRIRVRHIGAVPPATPTPAPTTNNTNTSLVSGKPAVTPSTATTTTTTTTTGSSSHTYVSTTLFECHPDEKLSEIQQRIAAAIGVPIADQILVHRGRTLTDSALHAIRAGIHFVNNSSVALYACPNELPATLKISVKALSGEVVRVAVDPSWRVIRLKTLLSRHLATRVDQIQLTYGVYSLSDTKSLSYYKIRKDSHLQMVARQQLSFEVLIGPLLGGPPERKEYFEYNAMLSIRTYKEMIQRRYGIPKIWQDLVCCGEVMDDRLALEDYDVFSPSPVALVNAQRRLVRNRLLLLTNHPLAIIPHIFTLIADWCADQDALFRF